MLDAAQGVSRTLLSFLREAGLVDSWRSDHNIDSLGGTWAEQLPAHLVKVTPPDPTKQPPPPLVPSKVIISVKSATS